MKTKTHLLAIGISLAVVLSGLGQPVITSQPQHQTNVLGATVTFIVTATGTPPLSYQWRFGTSVRPGATNSSFVLTNVQLTNQGVYSVIVTNSEGAVTSSIARLVIIVPPVITNQPASQAVEVGTTVTFTVGVTGTAPFRYQWRLNDANLATANTAFLAITNAQITHSGGYRVVITNLAGSITSMVAMLNVVPAAPFTSVSNDIVVSDPGSSVGCAWGDYDDDGNIDLFVANVGLNFLYRNNGNGSFTKIESGIVATNSPSNSSGGAWIDYDNDGRLDVFVSNGNLSPIYTNFLFRNLGAGQFERIMSGPLVNEAGDYRSAAWADYNRDGVLDMFVVNSHGGTNRLFAGDNAGGFTRIIASTLANEAANSKGCTWGDYNNDGFPDLFVARRDGDGNKLLYRNDGNGTFTKVTTGPVVSDAGQSMGCAWGDYDNDGHLDLFVANTAGHNNFLYHNLGNGAFNKVTNGPVVADGGESLGCAWGDYDNDGCLDLFVANGENGSQLNFLYHNNGDGTFTRMRQGSIATDLKSSFNCAWGDYNNDGFLDLFVCDAYGADFNSLYRNNGNSNNWISIKLAGAASNRSAIGARVKVRALINGVEVRQLREVSSATGIGSQNDSRVHFGLGDATTVEHLQVEWPSGTVQEFVNVPARQMLTIVEPPRLTVRGVDRGVIELQLLGSAGMRYLIERSSDFTSWTNWLTITATNRLSILSESKETDGGQFYRASVER